MDIHELEFQHRTALDNLTRAETAEDRRTYRELAGYFARRVGELQDDMRRRR